MPDDLGELSTLIWDPERPRLSLLLQQYAATARGFQVQNDFDAYLAGAFQCRHEEYRTVLFDAIYDHNIEWIGSQAFIKHGYLSCQEEDWEDADCKFQEDYRLGQMRLSTALEELGDAWGLDLFAEERHWHAHTTQEDAVDNWHTPDPEIPNHCYRDWIDPQAPP